MANKPFLAQYFSPKSNASTAISDMVRKALSPSVDELSKRVSLLDNISLDKQKDSASKHFSHSNSIVRLKAYPKLDPLKLIDTEKLKEATQTKKGRDISYIQELKRKSTTKKLSKTEIKSIPDLYYSVLPNKLKEINQIFGLLTSKGLEEPQLNEYKEMGKILMKTDILNEIDPLFIEKNKYFLININTKPYSTQLSSIPILKKQGELGIPSSRHDAIALNQWLDTFLSKLQNKTIPIKEKMDLFQAIYFISLREVIRQISVHCVERGEIVWRIFIAYMLMMNNLHLVYEDKMRANELEYQRRIGILQNFFDQQSEELKKQILDQSVAKEKAQSELAISHMENKELRKKLSANNNAVNIEIAKQNQLLKKLVASEQVNNELRKMIKMNKQQMFEDLNQVSMDKSSSSELSQLEGANMLFKLDNFKDETTDMDGFPESPKLQIQEEEPQPVYVEHKSKIPKLNLSNYSIDTPKKPELQKQSIDQLRINYMKQLEARKNFFVKPSYNREIQTEIIENNSSEYDENLSPHSAKKSNRYSTFFKKTSDLLQSLENEKKLQKQEKERYVALNYKNSTLDLFYYHPRRKFKDDIKNLFNVNDSTISDRGEKILKPGINRLVISSQNTPFQHSNSSDKNNASIDRQYSNKEVGTDIFKSNRDQNADGNDKPRPPESPKPNIKINGDKNIEYKDVTLNCDLPINRHTITPKSKDSPKSKESKKGTNAKVSPRNDNQLSTPKGNLKSEIDINILSNKTLLKRIETDIHQIKQKKEFEDLGENLYTTIKTLIKNIELSANCKPRIKYRYKKEVNPNISTNVPPKGNSTITNYDAIDDNEEDDLQLNNEELNTSNGSPEREIKEYPFKEFKFSIPKKPAPQMVNKDLYKLRMQVQAALQITKNIMDKRSLLKLISITYNENIRVNKDLRKDLTTHLYDKFSTKYGLISVAEGKIIRIMSTCIYYKHIPRIRLFSRFLKLYSHFSYGDYLYFLDILEFVRSIQSTYNIDNYDSAEHHYSPAV